MAAELFLLPSLTHRQKLDDEDEDDQNRITVRFSASEPNRSDYRIFQNISPIGLLLFKTSVPKTERVSSFGSGLSVFSESPGRATTFRGAAFLPLKKEGGGEEFVVLLNYTADLLVLRSSEMRWVRLKKLSDAICSELVAFRGKFYAGFLNNDIFVIDPYSLDTTPLSPFEFLNCDSCNDLVPSGNDELFLVEKIIPRSGLLDFCRLTLRVCKLDEEAGEWVVVIDIGDRLLFIGDLGNYCCSAKELPDGCGLSGNSIVFTSEPGNITHSYKYGVHTGREEDDLNCWRYTRERNV